MRRTRQILDLDCRAPHRVGHGVHLDGVVLESEQIGVPHHAIHRVALDMHLLRVHGDLCGTVMRAVGLGGSLYCMSPCGLLTVLIYEVKESYTDNQYYQTS